MLHYLSVDKLVGLNISTRLCTLQYEICKDCLTNAITYPGLVINGQTKVQCCQL